MAKFKVIEGTVWEIEGIGSLEEAKAIYEAHFNGHENAIYSMKELAGDSYWYGEEYKEGITDALSEIAEYFEGIVDSDLWAEYMTEEGEK